MDHRNDARSLDHARARLTNHPVLGPLALRVRVNCRPGNRCPPDAWAVVTAGGRIYAHPGRVGTVPEWTQLLAHLLLHLGLGHVQPREHPAEWNAACDVVVNRLLARLGLPPDRETEWRDPWDGLDEEGLYKQFCTEGIPTTASAGPAGAELDMLTDLAPDDAPNWPYLLGSGFRAGARVALERASHRGRKDRSTRETPALQARSWFIREFPLLGALASAFTIVEDTEVCRRQGIAIAAVRASLREIYLNPAAGLDAEECRFVIAHELLHVGLLHHRRRAWRHPFLWNIACDYVVNGWLLEMGVGTMPAFGGHHDLHLRGLSAEAVYARILDDLDRLRRCGTFRGIGVGDMLGDADDDPNVDLDGFLRRCLVNGLESQCRRGRGTMPAGLVEEIRGRLRPAIPWDAQLGRWFDTHLTPQTMRRSYARPSRRQSATPDIPRPRVSPVEQDSRTFGVVLDTSGSMARAMLADALGAIAGYASSREVVTIRLVFCDAEPYDQGYVPPEALLTWVDIRGRGGTVLQPAIDLLEQAHDFPASCPILIITDGLCDTLYTGREHAFLVPPRHALPFATAAPVFDMT
jgi:predicted metal-dependent peptidase